MSAVSQGFSNPVKIKLYFWPSFFTKSYFFLRNVWETNLPSEKLMLALGFVPVIFQPSCSSSEPHFPNRLKLLLAWTVGAQQVARTLGDFAPAAITTVSVTGNQANSLYIQWSSRPSAWLTSSRNRARLRVSHWIIANIIGMNQFFSNLTSRLGDS